MKLAPVLALAAILGVFMALDRLYLHWYTPDTGGLAAVERAAQPDSATSVRTPTQTAATVNPLPPTEVGSETVPTANPAASAPQAELDVILAQARNAFATLWAAGQRASYRVSYTTRSDSGEAGSTYVVYNLPPLSRVDTIDAGQTGASSQLVVDANGSTTACSLDGIRRQCKLIEPFAAPLPVAAGPIVFPEGSTLGSSRILEVFPRAIVGIAARCFQVPSSDAESTAEYCFSAEGVPVYANGPFGVVEASGLSQNVSSSDFQTP